MKPTRSVFFVALDLALAIASALSPILLLALVAYAVASTVLRVTFP